jgi:hypothetical protein
VTAPSFSVVIETANVGHDDLALRRSLASIVAQGPVLREAREVVVLTEPGVERLDAFAGEYPLVRLVEATGSSYGEMKASAAHVTTGDVIVFADSDCVYLPGWLEALLAPFETMSVDGVTGETAIPIRGAYSLAVAATFNFPGFTGDREVVRASRYWANNVALSRAALDSLVATDGVARGSCVFHARALAARGRLLVRHPAARSLHAPIPARDFVPRYLALGRDHETIASALRASGGPGRDRVPAYPPDRDGERPTAKVLRRMARAVAERPRRIVLVPLALPVVAAAAVLHTVGRRRSHRA